MKSTTICDICKNKKLHCPLCIVSGTYKWFKAKDGCWNCVNQVDEECKVKNSEVDLSDKACENFIKMKSYMLIFSSKIIRLKGENYLMKITTTLEVSKQEKKLIYNALEAYIKYLTEMLPDSHEGESKTLINTTLTDTNRLLSEMSQTF